MSQKLGILKEHSRQRYFWKDPKLGENVGLLGGRTSSVFMLEYDILFLDSFEFEPISCKNTEKTRVRWDVKLDPHPPHTHYKFQVLENRPSFGCREVQFGRRMWYLMNMSSDNNSYSR